MIYRKAPPQPPRFLLKVVAVGAGALLGVACGGTDAMGSVAMPPSDAGKDGATVGPCGGGPCGSVAMPTDAGEDADAYTWVGGGVAVGVTPNPEAGDEHEGVDAGFHGVIIAPQDSGSDEGIHFPGIIIRPPEAGSD
jgi:hypothetical protein